MQKINIKKYQPGKKSTCILETDLSDLFSSVVLPIFGIGIMEAIGLWIFQPL